jgi:hypothetical protein
MALNCRAHWWLPRACSMYHSIDPQSGPSGNVQAKSPEPTPAKHWTSGSSAVY